ESVQLHVTLALAQLALINNSAGKLVADSAMQQGRRDGRIDTAGQAEDHFLVTHLFTNLLDGVLDNVVRGPQLFAAADIAHETLQQTTTLQGMSHFRMELHAVEMLFVVAHAGNRAGIRHCRGDKTGRQRADAITVAHPHIKELMTGFLMSDNAVEQAIGFAFLHARKTELVLLAIDDLAAELFGHGLHAVANTQHRYAL